MYSTDKKHNDFITQSKDFVFIRSFFYSSSGLLCIIFMLSDHHVSIYSVGTATDDRHKFHGVHILGWTSRHQSHQSILLFMLAWSVLSVCNMSVYWIWVCVYMRDSRLSAILVCPSSTDPLVSGLCRTLWSSWLLTRLSTARYRYWYCSCGVGEDLASKLNCVLILPIPSKR